MKKKKENRKQKTEDKNQSIRKIYGSSTLKSTYSIISQAIHRAILLHDLQIKLYR